MKTLIFIFTLILMQNIFARGGDQVGNGGDVLVCNNQVEMVDIYEARSNGIEIDLGGNDLNYIEKAKYAFNRMSKFQPIRAKQYLAYLETFLSESKFASNVTLPDVDDAGIIIIPNGCALGQVAIQVDDKTVEMGYPRYTINKDFWDRLDNDNKAALLIHEIIFRELIQANAANSMLVRKFNQVIMNKNANEYDFIKINTAKNWEYFEIFNLQFKG